MVVSLAFQSKFLYLYLSAPSLSIFLNNQNRRIGCDQSPIKHNSGNSSSRDIASLFTEQLDQALNLELQRFHFLNCPSPR